MWNVPVICLQCRQPFNTSHQYKTSQDCSCEFTRLNEDVALEGMKTPILKWQPWTEPTQGSTCMKQCQQGCWNCSDNATTHSDDEPDDNNGQWSRPLWTSKKPALPNGHHSLFFFLFFFQTWDIVKTPVRFNEPVYLAVLQVAFFFSLLHSVMITTNSLRHQRDYLLKRPDGSAPLLWKSTIIEDKGRNTMRALLPHR